MNRRLVGMVVAAAGLILLVLSVLADSIGFGNEDQFGTRQIAGTIVGAAAMVVGVALVYAPRRGEIEPGAEK